jgi:uncharacterized C2H2 Zn-finger protein
MVKITEWEIVVESDDHLNKCPACGLVSSALFDYIKGHHETSENLLGQCPRCLSILRYKK